MCYTGGPRCPSDSYKKYQRAVKKVAEANKTVLDLENKRAAGENLTKKEEDSLVGAKRVAAEAENLRMEPALHALCPQSENQLLDKEALAAIKADSGLDFDVDRLHKAQDALANFQKESLATHKSREGVYEKGVRNEPDPSIQDWLLYGDGKKYGIKKIDLAKLLEVYDWLHNSDGSRKRKYYRSYRNISQDQAGNAAVDGRHN